MQYRERWSELLQLSHATSQTHKRRRREADRATRIRSLTDLATSMACTLAMLLIDRDPDTRRLDRPYIVRRTKMQSQLQ